MNTGIPYKLFENSITIRLMDDYQNVIKVVKQIILLLNAKIVHIRISSNIKLCGSVMDYSLHIEITQEIKDLINKIFNHPLITGDNEKWIMHQNFREFV